MALYDITGSQTSNLSNLISDESINSKNLDASQGQKEYTYQNTNFSKQWGIFNTIPQLKSAIIMKAIWTTGKGYTTDNLTMALLDRVDGWGKDTFDDIIFNMEVIKRVGGDAFAEIILDDKNQLLNLKPLDPSSIVIVTDNSGRIIRYEQVTGINKERIKFKPSQIFHLCHNRLGNQAHGLSDIDAMQETILAEYNNFKDVNSVMRKQARPTIMFKVKAGSTSRLASFIAKMDEATSKGENIYIPEDENTVSYEVIQSNVSAVLLEWKRMLSLDFYRAVGIPLVLFGSAGTTESGGKIEYLSHEQVFSKDQRYLEKQIWNQLFIKIKFYPPSSLMENLQTDESKDSQNALTFQSSDVTAGSGA